LEKLNEAAGRNDAQENLKQLFLDTRLAYKRSSVMVDYFFPIQRKVVNGPDLRYAEDDNPDAIHDPHGFQVIERIIYDDEINYTDLKNEISSLLQTIKSIDEQPGLDYKLRSDLLFDAMKSAVIRMVSLGVTGFDSPIALNALEESEGVLEGIAEILKIYRDDAGTDLASKAKQNLKSATNFDSFDRLRFIKDFADPLYSHLVNMVVAKRYELPVERRPINQFATSIFSDTLFNIHFFSPNERYRMTPERVAIGKTLFYDTVLSRAGRSCATCHQPSKGFSDGLRVPVAINKTTELKRNTPTLSAVAFQTKFFYDSRAATLENQLNSVVHNIDEMDGSLKESTDRIRENPDYHKQFSKAYPNDKPAVTAYTIANAISSYLRSLPVFDTKFDRYMRGEAKLSREERKGFNLFAGKAKCATCHFIPLFNGLVPPQFTETESEVLGVPAANSVSGVDADEGKYMFTRSEVHRHAFKTPTLRNITRTAPYMHNGAFKTLEEVMDFYNKGGGAGMGFNLDNQTLPADSLGLSKREMKSIIVFLRTLEN
ncbi:MAG: cytochrome C peroxidase, partial [Chitinophagaceae bacterium]|nr:cytochrome C peroxidase [Chitinophagaceae bacterium]